MAKLNAKSLAMVLFLGILLVGVIGIVNAQQALPKGGDSFETAVKLEPGSFQGASLGNKEVEYFYVVVKAGEEIQVKGTFTAADIEVGAEAILALYSEDKTKLVEKIEGFYDKPTLITASWLAGKVKDSYKCYIKVGSNLFEIASYSLDVSVKAAPAEGAEEKAAAPVIGEEMPKGVPTEGPNWTLILGIIAVIVVVGIIVYFLLKKKK